MTTRSRCTDASVHALLERLEEAYGVGVRCQSTGIPTSPAGHVAQEGGAMELLRTIRTAEALEFHGEIDLGTVDILREALAKAVGSGITTVDLSGVSFMDSTGLHVLASTGASLNGQGPLVLLHPSRSVARFLGIALPGAMPGVVIHPD